MDNSEESALIQDQRREMEEKLSRLLQSPLADILFVMWWVSMTGGDGEERVNEGNI